MSAVKTLSSYIQGSENGIKINDKSTQNRCLKTAAKITHKMSQSGPKWDPKCVKNLFKNA